MYTRVSLLRNLQFSTESIISKNPHHHLRGSDYLLPRHIGPNDLETQLMLKECGSPSLESLIRQAIPPVIIDPQCLQDNAILEAVPEKQFLGKLKDIFAKNKNYKSFLGCGFNPTIMPAVIQRNILENPGWYTAYTPYQAEIAQGRLESLLNFQTMIQQLTGLEFSNASLLDEASAGGQAFYMAYNIHNGEKRKIFIDEYVFTPTAAVVQTKARYLGAQVIIGRYQDFLTGKYQPSQFCAVIVQTPDSDGLLTDFTNFFKKIDNLNLGIVKVVASDLLSLTITKQIGSMNADICFGSSQRLGVPMGFGGPSSGFFATKKQNLRKIPGRIIGISKDKQQKIAYRMALQTREQHIRREKATSNICTAQALLANISVMYAIYHGPKGLRQISERINNLAQITERIFIDYGFKTISQDNKFCQYFDTITVTECDALSLIQAFLKHQMNIRMNDDHSVSISFSEVNTSQDLQLIIKVLAQYKSSPIKTLDSYNLSRKPFGQTLGRSLDFMKQSIFNQIHSETQMLRYLKHLQDKDLSLDRSMIPLGSCTMKLNATSEMIPLSWPELNIHPFAPKSQVGGYLQVINKLKQQLKSITKFDDISFQSNSGATGEYAGLITIRSYLQAQGESKRKLCLIPRSAHGTNPASANLAGMVVLPIQVSEGKIDLNDFKIKAEKHKNQLGALMITFPSTAGRYEETIRQVIDISHFYGCQVYMDGANMNAQVGYTSPGFLGADVCHLNLHKTFSIPHGGGGPGMGPIGVKKHLIPYLPTHPYSMTYNASSSGSITASQFGSASILTISHAYISLLGKHGVKKATAYAILNANYIMKRLRPYYKVMYLGENQRCSHQFILDINPIKKATKITEQDIAKRLMDYGFHAPTMSFPIPGTLMIQPTQSEDKGQLDRFADALIRIHHEIHHNPQIVRNAPYTAECLVRSKWQYPFTREEAAYPLPYVLKRGKFWPSVRRIQNSYGDKNLVCSCPDISSYTQ